MIYLLKFDSGDTFVGSSYSRLGDEPPSLRSAKQLYSLIEKVELEECTEEEAPKRLAHWIEVLDPSITWVVGNYSHPEIVEVLKLFTNTNLSLKEIADVTHVNYDTVKKVLQGRVHKGLTKDIDLTAIKKGRKKTYKVYTLDGELEYEVAGLFELKQGLKPGFLSRLKKSGYELPIERFSFKPYDPKVYQFKSDEGIDFEMNKLDAFRVLKECGVSKTRIQQIFDGKHTAGWQIVHNLAKNNWFPS